MESTITNTELQNLIQVGKAKRLISPDEAQTLITLSKETLTTREGYANTTITTERVVNKSEINLKDIDSDLLNKLIELQEHKVKEFKDTNPTVLLETEDDARFKSALRREKIYNWIFFIFFLVIAPVLIFLALFFFAPAVLVSIGHICTIPGGGAGDGLGEAIYGTCLFLGPPALCLGLVLCLHQGIEAILGRRIFTGKWIIASLAAELTKEEELLVKLKDHKVSREEELNNTKEPNVTLSNASSLDSINSQQEISSIVNSVKSRNSLFAIPSSQERDSENSDNNVFINIF